MPRSVTPAFHRRVFYETDTASCDFPPGTLSDVFCDFAPSSMEMLQLCRKILSYYIYIYIAFTVAKLGPGSSVGIATDYGLDGPRSNAGWDEIFRPSRPALGPTQPPIKWVPVLSQE